MSCAAWLQEALLYDLPSERRISYYCFGIALGISLATFEFIGPVKTAVFVNTVGTAQEPVARTCVLVCLLPLLMLYSIAVTSLNNGKLLAAVMNGFYALVFLAIAFALPASHGEAKARVAWTLYFAAETKGVILMPMMWSIVADVSTSELSKKAYPFIFFVGQLGGIAGSCMAIKASSLGGEVGLLLIQSVALVAIAVLIWVACQVLEGVEEQETASLLPAPPPEVAVESARDNESRWSQLRTAVSARLWEGVEGLWLLTTRPYALMTFWVSYAVLMPRTMLDYQNTVLVKAAYPKSMDQIGYFGRMLLIQHLGVCVITLLGTQQLIELVGVAKVLLVLPMSTLLCVWMICVDYRLLTSTVACITCSTIAYSLNSPCKEILFVRTSRDIKYKAKSWSEMYGNNLMKSLGAQINLWVNNESRLCNPHCFHPGFTASVAFLWTAGWIAVVDNVGREFQELDAKNKIVS
mmetsp:Transcript_102412/g.187009  ORF Transcript_102412/g.187009 Transcript_102412/m.187009 type:complete len:466 (-) Transcript_102412:30-1427(-)